MWPPPSPLLVCCPPLLSTDADAGAPAVVDCSQSAHDRDADIEPAGTVDAAEDDIEEAPDVTVEVFLRAFCEKQASSRNLRHVSW